MGGWVVAIFGKGFLEIVVSQFSRLFEAIHCSSDFNVDKSVRCCFVVELVFRDDFLGNSGELHLHVFILIK